MVASKHAVSDFPQPLAACQLCRLTAGYYTQSLAYKPPYPSSRTIEIALNNYAKIKQKSRLWYDSSMSVRAPECILGIDPGYGRLGFGVLRKNQRGDLEYVSCGVITTLAGTDMPVRLQEIAADFRSLLARYQPDLLVIEQLYFVQNITTGIKVAEVRGVIQLLAIEAHVPIVEVHPTEVKLALTGQGHADKHQMQKMITTLLRLETVPSPDDAADALAIAWAGERKYRLPSS